MDVIQTNLTFNSLIAGDCFYFKDDPERYIRMKIDEVKSFNLITNKPITHFDNKSVVKVKASLFWED